MRVFRLKDASALTNEAKSFISSAGSFTALGPSPLPSYLLSNPSHSTVFNVASSSCEYCKDPRRPTLVLSSEDAGDAGLLTLALLARGSFYNNVKAFELMEECVDDLVARDGNKTLQLLDAFYGTEYPSDSFIIDAFRQATNLNESSCVALGTLKEAEIARGTGQCAPATVGRLVRLLKALTLPNKMDRRNVDPTAVRYAFLKSAQYSPTIRMALPSGCFTFEVSKIGLIDVRIVERVLSDALVVIPPAAPFGPSALSSYQVRVPGSKSVSNRALLLAGLSKGSCALRGLLHSDDTQVMMTALEQLGAQFTWIENGAAVVVKGNGGMFAKPKKPLWMGNAGTATRFVISLCCLVQDPTHSTIIEGSHRMEERPQSDLVDALVENGCRVEYRGKPGHLPLAMGGGGFRGGKMQLSGKISSQFVSSVLLAAPFANEPLELTLLEAEPTSISYIEMTLETMAEFGVKVERLAINKFRVPNDTGFIAPPKYDVEADASSATYALACATIFPQRSITVNGVGSTSLQGDAKFGELLASMGASLTQNKESTTVVGRQDGLITPPHESGLTIDMGGLTDAFLTACVVAAMCPESSYPTHISGIANQHVKECDRIAAMCKQLAKCGVQCENLADGIIVYGAHDALTNLNRRVGYFKNPIELDTYDDHRVAMSFAVLGTRVPGLVILDKDCTDKTYPEFWDDLETCLDYKVEAFPRRMQVWENQSLVLVGMRGAGKTTLGKKAAQHLGWSFYDLDDLLCQEMGMPNCGAVVDKVGWVEFRKIEYKVLCDALREKGEKCVLACGGGVVETAECRARLDLHFPVLNVERHFDDVDLVLNKSSGGEAAAQPESKKFKTVQAELNRPQYGEPVSQVWERRKPWLSQVADYDFYAPRSGSFAQLEKDWPEIELDFVRLLENMRRAATPDVFSSCGDLHSQVVLNHAHVGVHVKEVLADLRRGANGYKPLLISVDESSVGLEKAHELWRAAARTGCEAIRLPSNEFLGKHYSKERGAMLSAFGPVRVVVSGAVDQQAEKAIVQYPGKSLSVLPVNKMYYLFGHPIFSSPSPTMHNEAFGLLGHKLNDKRYTIFSTMDARRVNAALQSSTFGGASVTIPHKQNLQVLDIITDEAKSVGAINTVVKTKTGELVGENTDWIGIRNCLLKGGINSQGAVLVVGAGGTARAACFCVKRMNLKLFLYNRTRSKAEELAKEFNGVVIASLDEQLELVGIVSTVPASSNWTAPAHWLNTTKPVVLDAAYRPRRTKLLEQAKELGCPNVEGIEMLIEQGIEQVRVFESRSVDLEARAQVKLTEEQIKRIRNKVYAFYEG